MTVVYFDNGSPFPPVSHFKIIFQIVYVKKILAKNKWHLSLRWQRASSFGRMPALGAQSVLAVIE